MRKVMVFGVILLVAVYLLSCGLPLASVVDTHKTNEALYQEFEFQGEYTIAAVSALGVTDILDGMLSAASGIPGTQVWYYNGLLGEFYVYIWNIDGATGGFSLLNCDGRMVESILNQSTLGHVSSTYEIADLIVGLKEQGFVRVDNPHTNLPPRASAEYIRGLMEAMPATLPIWKIFNNTMIFVFPETMIWWGPIEGGNS